MKRLQMNIPDELHKRLKLYCVHTDQEITEVVLRLVEEFLAKEEKKLKK